MEVKPDLQGDTH
jgi:hypothetical protein